MQWSSDKNHKLSDNQIAIWLIDLDVPKSLDELYSYLSDEEQAKADKLKFEPVKRQFVITRGNLRYLLSQYLNQPPNTIAIDYHEKGKPYLTNLAWQFNVSHCEGAAVIAISPNISLGVDIEALNRKVDIEAVSAEIFTEQEQNYISKSPDKQLAFIQCWTRKEAFIKAHGAGMYSDLKAISITNVNGEIIQANDENDCRWFTTDLPMQGNYHISVTASIENADIVLYD